MTVATNNTLATWRRPRTISNSAGSEAGISWAADSWVRRLCIITRIYRTVARFSLVPATLTRLRARTLRPQNEKAFGWMKQTGGIRKTKLRGLWKVGWQFLMTAAAFNLWRLPKLQTAEV